MTLMNMKLKFFSIVNLALLLPQYTHIRGEEKNLLNNSFFPYSEIIDSTLQTFEEAKLECDKDVSCAGVSTNDTFIYAHSFLPQEIDIGYTYHSPRSFTIHSGRIDRGIILSIGHGGMTVPEAKIYCELHPSCVAFTYLVYSMQLTSPNTIVFVSSVNRFSDNGMGEWRMYISNDLNKAKYVNASSIEYDDLPYPVCCEEKETPSIEDIEAVDTFPRISCNISREEFYEKYEKTRTPVMLVGCDENWKAKERWTIDKLLSRFSNSSKWRGMIEDDPDDSRELVNWSEVIDRKESSKRFYIFDNVFQSREENKQLEEDYDYPHPFQGADLYGNLKDFRSIDDWFRWFIMGPRNTGSHPHMDPQATDAWNALVTGHKWWILYPNSDFKDSDELKCNRFCSGFISEKSWFTSVGINALRNECSNGEFPQHILQKPGETIYVPYGLYHAVFNMDETVGVTANFGSAANLWSVWHEIVIARGNYWKYAYYEILNKEQRKQLRDWNLWPVENIDMEKYDKDSY